MQLFNDLQQGISNHYDLNALSINDTYYSYAEFAKAISKIWKAIEPLEEKNIGLIANDDLETYSAILAIWIKGKAYVYVLIKASPSFKNRF